MRLRSVLRAARLAVRVGLLAAEVGELLALARELGLHLLLLVDGVVDAATGSNGGADAARRHEHHEGDQGQGEQAAATNGRHRLL